MINAIIKGIFSLITKIASMILSPIIAVITALFPSLGIALTNVIAYFVLMFRFIPLALTFMMIPREAMIFLFDYYIIKYTIYISVRAVKSAIVVYNKLKI